MEKTSKVSFSYVNKAKIKTTEIWSFKVEEYEKMTPRKILSMLTDRFK